MLGPVEVRLDGARLPVQTGKTTELLIRLALEAGALVRTDRLIEDLWADAAPATARNTLQQKVSRLRRSLGDAARVTGTAAGYVLEVDTSAVDALAVFGLADAAAGLRRSGDPAAATVADSALALFRGDVLVDGGDGDWLLPQRIRLEELRSSLREISVASRLDAGAAGEVVAELEALVAETPMRETFWELLITALYRDGRQADALAAYTRVRHVLADELGLEPGPGLQDVERRVLLQDPTLLGATIVPTAAGGNLPPAGDLLVGRDVEVKALQALVREKRLVSVFGPGGVGKTRLAVEVARAEPSAWLVRLDTATGRRSIMEAVADAIGVVRRSEASVVDGLRGTGTLIIFDTCEHVADDVGAVVGDLLAACPRLRVLCTTQVVLGVESEAVFVLDPLKAEDAASLFIALASQHRRSLAPDVGTVALLCASLDGLPLAIELAAARVKTLSVDDIHRRLDDRFSVLRDPSSRRPPRQRALETALSWSYDLLFPDDQRGLMALAAFAGGAPVAAFESVLVALGLPAASTVDIIARLADRSLLYVDDVEGVMRYRLLDSVRALALDRLDAAGLSNDARRAHAQWFAEAARRADVAVRSFDQPVHLALVRTERANIDAALAWSADNDPLLGLSIANGFAWCWVVLGVGSLGTERLRAALNAADGVVSDSASAETLFNIAWLESGNDVVRAEADARRGLDLDVAAPLIARLKVALAFTHVQQGRSAEALPLLEDARATYRVSGSAWDEGQAWLLTTHAASAVGDISLADHACSEADLLLRDLGDDWALDHLDAALGHTASAAGRYEDAAAHLSNAADAASRLGYAATEGYHRAALGRVLHQAGQNHAAVSELRRAVEIGAAAGELRLVALARTWLGVTLVALSDTDAGRVELLAADHWFRSSGGGQGADVAADALMAIGP